MDFFIPPWTIIWLPRPDFPLGFPKAPSSSTVSWARPQSGCAYHCQRDSFFPDPLSFSSTCPDSSHPVLPVFGGGKLGKKCQGVQTWRREGKVYVPSLGEPRELSPSHPSTLYFSGSRARVQALRTQTLSLRPALGLKGHPATYWIHSSASPEPLAARVHLAPFSGDTSLSCSFLFSCPSLGLRLGLQVRPPSQTSVPGLLGEGLVDLGSQQKVLLAEQSRRGWTKPFTLK